VRDSLTPLAPTDLQPDGDGDDDGDGPAMVLHSKNGYDLTEK
jgi:hypothetical protein